MVLFQYNSFSKVVAVVEVVVGVSDSIVATGACVALVVFMVAFAVLVVVVHMFMCSRECRCCYHYQVSS